MRKKRMANDNGGATTKLLFGNNYSERKILEFLRNTINSVLALKKPIETFSFALEALGWQRVIPPLFKKFQVIKDESPFEWRGKLQDRLASVVPAKAIVHFLRDAIISLIDKRLRQLKRLKVHEMELRVRIIGDVFKLTREELEILSLIYFFNVESVIREFYCNTNNIIDLSNISVFASHGHYPLGMRRELFCKILREGRIFQVGVLCSHSGFRSTEVALSPWSEEYLSCYGGRELIHKFFTLGDSTVLTLDDLEVASDELLVIEEIMHSSKGHNILFYGQPGTGKTTLARCLASKFSRQLLSVNVPRSDDHAERIGAIHAALALADTDTMIILIDEADDLLNTHNNGYGKSKTSKSWINDLLENHRQKIIWITNNFDDIQPSTMRRFSFSMEFKPISKDRRLRIFESELERCGLGSLFSEEELRSLSQSYSGSAGGIAAAVSLIQPNHNNLKVDRVRALTVLRTVLRNHQKAVFGMLPPRGSTKDMRHYSLDGLNCSEDPRRIITALQRFIDSQDADSGETGSNAVMLLYGLPGTGKSEFVHYMGHCLGKEVLLKRASDILSCWVGATEQNIASSFRQAEDNRSILFFDEADTFLFPRREASHSWEKSFTNEILAQLDSFHGIVVFATNDLAGLDHASLRRFRFKIEFRPLTPEGNIHFYKALLSSLVTPRQSLNCQEEATLRSVKNLTPGDFAVVKDSWSMIDRANLTHRDLIASLIQEIRYKTASRNRIGFTA